MLPVNNITNTIVVIIDNSLLNGVCVVVAILLALVVVAVVVINLLAAVCILLLLISSDSFVFVDRNLVLLVVVVLVADSDVSSFAFLSLILPIRRSIDSDGPSFVAIEQRALAGDISLSIDEQLISLTGDRWRSIAIAPVLPSTCAAAGDALLIDDNSWCLQIVELVTCRGCCLLLLADGYLLLLLLLLLLFLIRLLIVVHFHLSSLRAWLLAINWTHAANDIKTLVMNDSPNESTVRSV